MTATYQDAKNAKATGKPLTLRFGDGLYLWVTPAGTKSWRCNYIRAGRNQIAVLGHFPAMTINEARAARLAIRMTVREGGDPGAERHARKAARNERDRSTVRAVGEAWVATASRSSGWSASHTAMTTRRLELHVYPTLGEVPVALVSKQAVIELLGNLSNRYRAQAVHCRHALSGLFDFAADQDLVPVNPVTRVARYLPKRVAGDPAELPRAHVRTIEEARAVLRAIETSNATAPVLLAHRLLALTATRKLEAIEAEWSEVDFERGLWTVPGHRMKGRRGQKVAHVIPLSDAALDVFKAAWAIAAPGATLVFACRPGAGVSISRSTLNDLMPNRLALAGLAGRHVPHGWRSTFSTILNEADPRAYRVIDAMLAHKPTGASLSESHYNHATYQVERRRIANEWAELLLLGAPTSRELIGLDDPRSNILPMREAA